jgi:hypothetical protein
MSGRGDDRDRELAYYRRLLDEMAAEKMRLDHQHWMLRTQLRQKREAFQLLSTLAASIGPQTSVAELLRLVALEMHARLGMDRVVVLEPAGRPMACRPTHWAGFQGDTADGLAQQVFELPAELASRGGLLLVATGDPDTPLVAALRAGLEVRTFACVPILGDEAPLGFLLAGRNLQGTMFPALDEGDVGTLRAIGGVIEAVVRNARIARLEQTQRLKAELFANLSHELRTPLTLTLGPLERIGLALVKEIATLHGGVVAVESAEGRGTSFIVSIPLGAAHLAEGVRAMAATEARGAVAALVAAPAPAAGDADADNRAAEASFDETRPVVLYVEDDAELRAHVREVLAPAANVPDPGRPAARHLRQPQQGRWPPGGPALASIRRRRSVRSPSWAPRATWSAATSAGRRSSTPSGTPSDLQAACCIGGGDGGLCGDPRGPVQPRARAAPGRPGAPAAAPAATPAPPAVAATPRRSRAAPARLEQAPEPADIPVVLDQQPAEAAPPPEDRWEVETGNAGWARDAERSVTDAIVGALGSTKGLQDLQCRSSVCRAVVQVDDVKALIEFQKNLVMSADGWPGEASFLRRETGADGPVVVDCYLGAPPSAGQ